jgi:integrating conjugative element membrane protein (TIGR03747 family)
MAVNTQTRQYSKRLIVNVVVISVLGWLLLFCWTMTLWVRFGFESTWQRLYQLSNQQRASIVQFSDESLAERLSSTLANVPMESLSNKVSEINQSIQEALPDEPFIVSSELNNLTHDALRVAKQLWMFVGITGHVMLIKLTILLAAIPLFVLAMTAGLVDGLNQRAIRTASLGRESSYVFHQLNRLFKRGLVVLLGLWLAIPVSITPALMLVPVSVLLSVMVSVTASRFKKYL